jgi:DNA-binding MarR family transcriptional regulator
MKKTPSADEDFKLLVALHHTTNAIVRAREKELYQYGLTYMQAAVLFTIQTVGDRATPAEIARWLFREAHSVSGLINRMEKAGLVTKVKDLDRKNWVRVAMTEKGEQAYSDAIKRESLHKIMSTLSNEDRKALRRHLKLLRDRAINELDSHRRTRLPYFPVEKIRAPG